MNHQLLTGQLTRLVAFDPDRAAELSAKWSRDTEFSRNYDLPPVLPRDAQHMQTRFTEQQARPQPPDIQFHIAALDNAQIIGECELEMNQAAHREAFVAIGIGERALWGRGFGSDAMKLLLGFGFREWNLHRISLAVFSYNLRARHSYLKCGFQIEGRVRGNLKRGGARHDLILMGILRDEWQHANP